MAIPKMGGGGGGAREKKVRMVVLAKDDMGMLGDRIIMPDSTKKLTWDVISVILLVFTVTVTPLKVCFSVVDVCPSGSWWIDLCIDAFFLTDFCINFFTAAWITDQHGEQRLSGKLNVIACEYLKSWFLIDLSSSLPLDVVFSLATEGCPGVEATAVVALDANTNVASGVLRMVRLGRMMKLLKILRILKLRQRFNELADQFPFLSNMRFIQLSSVFVFIAYVVHLLACGFWLVGAMTFYETTDQTVAALAWINVDDALPPPPPNMQLSWAEVGVPYIASLYWTVTTITTVGFGDITPTCAAAVSTARPRPPPPSHRLAAPLPPCLIPPPGLVRSLAPHRVTPSCVTPSLAYPCATSARVPSASMPSSV